MEEISFVTFFSFILSYFFFLYKVINHELASHSSLCIFGVQLKRTAKPFKTLTGLNVLAPRAREERGALFWWQKLKLLKKTDAFFFFCLWSPNFHSTEQRIRLWLYSCCAAMNFLAIFCSKAKGQFEETPPCPFFLFLPTLDSGLAGRSMKVSLSLFCRKMNLSEWKWLYVSFEPTEIQCSHSAAVVF